MASIYRWGLKDGNRLARTVGKELQNPAKYTPQEFIEAANRALKKYPNEWAIYYSLADNYQKLGFHAEALMATQKCVEIRPRDIRSIYALATSYNMFTLAAWSDKEDEIFQLFKNTTSFSDKIDKKYSQAGLDHTGLVIETAALQAIRWFEHALQMKPDRASRNQISQDLNALYNRFPNLRR